MTDSANQKTDQARLHHRLRAIHYVASWLSFAAFIFFNYQESAESIVWFFGFFWVLTLTLWCREDAIVNQKALPALSLWIVFFFWPIAIPACTIHLHGLLYGSILIAMHAMIYLVASALPALFLFTE